MGIRAKANGEPAPGIALRYRRLDGFGIADLDLNRF